MKDLDCLIPENVITSPETSVTEHQPKTRNIPEELYRGAA